MFPVSPYVKQNYICYRIRVPLSPGLISFVAAGSGFNLIYLVHLTVIVDNVVRDGEVVAVVVGVEAVHVVV